ncbi:hypothetical protein PHMEG_00030382 [Phytophthora megakarya]|uniref:Uncharacterized protein n=1 Tax=Phytophthora megakarya TaxID=4795 RepID=A0A225V0F2_9STRA|nr:hypothetical protein PHMEG_00030382 [Phytophthora megakarya]
MVQLDIRIRRKIKQVEAIGEMITPDTKHRKILALFKHIKMFEKVCFSVERYKTNPAEINHSKALPKIIHSPAFKADHLRLFSVEELIIKNFEVGQAPRMKRKEKKDN